MPIRRLLVAIAAAATLSIILLVIPAYGDRSDPARLQTWPSRTPTSEPNPPGGGGGQPGGGGGEPGDGGGSGESPTPTPLPPIPGQGGTATAVIATSIATLPAAGTSHPSGSVVSTAEPCGRPPTALATEAITVRDGPGDTFRVAGRIDLLAVRPVIGRDAHAPWWLVALENGQAGWIPDRAVIIHGYTGAVDVFAIANPGNATPEPSLWNPTPNPKCVAGASMAPGASTAASSASADPAGSEDSITEGVASEISGDPSASANGDGQRTGESVTGIADASEQGGSLPGGALEDRGGSLTWLLVIGIVLILGGVIVLLLQGRFSRSGSST